MKNTFERNSRETRRPDGEQTSLTHPNEVLSSLDDLLQSLPVRSDSVSRSADPDVTPPDNAELFGRSVHPKAPEEDLSSLSHLYEALAQQRTDEFATSDSINIPFEFTNASSPLGSLNIDSDGLPHTPAAARLILPEVDDEVFGFRLLHELGRGAFARVFLVKQGELANREVVLKISAIEGTEPQTLAQLQHTNVVPIYSVHEDVRSGLRAVCMPYLGGACLAEVLGKVWKQQVAPENGGKLIEALDSVAGPPLASHVSPSGQTNQPPVQGKIDHESDHTPRTTLAGLSYVQATAWIVSCLAEGLQHSHERKVIHRDIKPSNILISAEAQPLLLDFNVAQDKFTDSGEATVAGTIPYMAPEQLRAMIKRDHESLSKVTHQADIYSLGLVLYEMLSGVAPFLNEPSSPLDAHPLDGSLREREQVVPSLRARCSLVIPWSLESIVRKSLAPVPAARYASAAQMAEDLTRFLEDRPLKFAPELSRVEQLQKWSRRHPRLTTASTVLLIAISFIVPVALLLQFTRNDLAAQRSLVTDARASDLRRAFENAAQKGLCLVNTVVQNEDTLKSGIKACEDALAMYGVLQNPNWEQGTLWLRLKQAEREQLSESVRELLLVLGSAYLRAQPDNQHAVQQAVELVKVAQRLSDARPSKALLLDQARYLTLLGMDNAASQARTEAETVPATSAHDIYMLATAHARHRTVQGYREAIDLLTQATEQSPKHYWSFFQRALCYQELGETVLAVSDLGRCVGLWPESSWAHFNLGYLLDLQGRKAAAVDEYTDCIEHAPTFVSAYFNRGLAFLELQKYTDALGDFDKAKSLGRTDALVDAGRAMAYEGMGRHDEADKLFDGVLKQARKMSDSDAGSKALMQRIRWTYGFAVTHRAPQFSARIFEEILEADPKHPEAWYGKGMLLMQQGHLQDAVHAFDEALAVAPMFIEPLRYRAVSLARLGQLQQAAIDANSCAEREPTNSDSLYVAACVASLSARKLNSQELSDNALELLERAIACGASRERAQADPDFAALRGDPAFQKLVAPSRPSKPVP